LDSQNASYYASKGNCRLQLDQIQDALTEFNKAIALAPGDGNYLINRALVYAKLDDYNVNIFYF
jgi:tetratricopeptide (TPR) repeat protein